jgi:BMFP domain-containing protein YqiC
MVDKNFFDELSQQISRLLPAANAMGEDIKKTVSAAMQSSFQKMDLVTREEFEAQVAALQRAQEKIAAMEAVIGKLEKQPGSSTEESDDTPPADTKYSEPEA